MKSFTRVSTAVIIGLSLTACGQKSSDEHFEAAQTFLANDQFNSALVELKSALQKDPERADFRLALAQLYVQVGALDDAVKEYQRADQYSQDNSTFIQDYVKVLYLNSNYSDILTLLEDTSAYAQPEQDYLLTYKALAEAELGGTLIGDGGEILSGLAEEGRRADDVARRPHAGPDQECREGEHERQLA